MGTRNCFMRICDTLDSLPAAVLCVFTFVLQASALDYYLVHHLGASHVTWLGADAVFVVLLILCIQVARWGLVSQNHHWNANLGWVTWLVYSTFVAAKIIVIFAKFADELEEEDPSFFGPNTLKTAIALASVMFLLLLLTQHDAPLGSERRRYIEELTGTVAFDLLDTVDILEILFDENKSEDVWQGLGECILTVSAMNLMLPTIPLLTLSKTQFGRFKLQRRYVYLHRLLLVLIVNVPNLLIRMGSWHEFNAGVSPFTLKNIILIGMTFYEFYQYKREKCEESGEDDGNATDMQSTGKVLDDVSGCEIGKEEINHQDRSTKQTVPSGETKEEIHEGMAIECRLYF